MNTRQFVLLCRILLAILVSLPMSIGRNHLAETLARELDDYEASEYEKT